MFESLKHWLESLNTLTDEQSLFDHRDDEAIHIAVASLLYHIIAVDEIESDREKHRFSSILKNQFNLNEQQIAQLYAYVKTLNSDIQSDLNTVNLYLKNKPMVRMNFMAKINQLMSLDGINSKELDIFYDAMKILFPEIEVNDSNF